MKRLGFIAIILSLLFTIFSPTPKSEAAKVFSDVPADFWAAEQIYRFTDANVINGRQNGTYAPNESLTRAQAAIILAGALELDSDKGSNLDYTDVKAGHYAYDAIKAMKSEGIMNGSNGKFRPNGTLTRAHMAIILAEAFEFKGDNSSHFNDVAEDYYARDHIDAIFAHDVTVGYENATLFKPNNPTTRAQFAVFLAKAMDSASGIETTKPNNRGPGVLKQIPEQSTKVGRTIELDLSNYFMDTDLKDSLTFTSTEGNIYGNTWSFDATDAKELPVTITATDTYGEHVSTTFTVVIEDVPQADSLYDAIYTALVNLEPDLVVSEFTTDSNVAFDTLKEVLADHPEIYYFEFQGSLFWSSGYFELNYKFPTEEIVEMNNKLKAKADSIISKQIKDGMSDYEKVKAIHDYVVLNTAYDYQNYLNNTVPDGSYNIYGLLLDGMAVCDGYSKTMKYLLEKIGIETLYVTGFGNGGAHSWIKVKVDGEWYNLDATWDDPVPNREGYVRYDYFLITDSELARDHQWDNSGFPKATSTKY